jgi:hypothetical protein
MQQFGGQVESICASRVPCYINQEPVLCPNHGTYYDIFRSALFESGRPFFLRPDNQLDAHGCRLPVQVTRREALIATGGITPSCALPERIGFFATENAQIATIGSNTAHPTDEVGIQGQMGLP